MMILRYSVLATIATIALASNNFWQFAGAFLGAFLALYIGFAPKRIAAVISDAIKIHEKNCRFKAE